MAQAISQGRGRLVMALQTGWKGLYGLAIRAGRRIRDLVELNVQYVREWRLERRALACRDDQFYAGLRQRVYTRYPCYFVLSTGRCGTMLLTRMLRMSDQFVVYHSPQPELAVESVQAYAAGGRRSDFFAGVVTGARAEYVEAAAITDRTFIETNPKITFFARHVKRVFSGARFVHLIRDPVDFARSAVSRGYYQSHRTERRHIRPPEASGQPAWDQMSLIQKAAWCWAETNAFIDKFAQELPNESMIKVTSQELFSDPGGAIRIARFCGDTDLSSDTVGRLLNRKFNRSLRDASSERSRGAVIDEITEVPLVEKVARRHNYLD